MESKMTNHNSAPFDALANFHPLSVKIHALQVNEKRYRKGRLSRWLTDDASMAQEAAPSLLFSRLTKSPLQAVPARQMALGHNVS